MRFGRLIEGTTVDDITSFVSAARDSGYTSAWLTDGLGFEPLTVLAMVGREVPDIELGTAVVRTFPKHPMALAQQALTASAATGRRLVLGIGPSHRRAMEEQWGISYDRVIHHVREYLSVLKPLVEEGSVDYSGDVYSARASFHIDDGLPCPVLLGALGARMLDLAGRMADGTVTFMTGPRTLRSFTCPALHTAAARAGRPVPRVVALLPIVVTDDVGGTRARLADALGAMARVPSYAAAVEREGGLPLVAGTEEEVADELVALADAGVTDFVPTRLARRGSDDEARTQALVASLAARD
jgi:F420-dependent oxidoreductase-like protein